MARLLNLTGLRREYREAFDVVHISSRKRWIVFTWTPLLAMFVFAVWVCCSDYQGFDDASTAGLIGGLTLLSGLLFGAAISCFEKIVDLDIAGPLNDKSLTTSTRRLLSISALALHAALLAGVVAGVLIVGLLIPSATKVTSILIVGGLLRLFLDAGFLASWISIEARNRANSVISGQSHDRVNPIDSHR